MTRTQYKELFIRFSVQFLTEPLPDNFFDMTEEEQMLTIVDKNWGAFDYHGPEELYSLIDSLIYDVQLTMKKGI
jgi:hypothetical protein